MTVTLVTGALGRSGFTDHDKTLDGYNPEQTWASLQASAGAAIGGAGKTRVDSLVAGTRRFRLRLKSGIYAPAWVKSAVGSFTVVNCQDGSTGTVPYWWTTDYIDLWEDFQVKMAALYDGNIDLVWETGAMHIYDEPFQSQFHSTITANVTNKSTGIVKTGIQWATANRAGAVAGGYDLGDASTPGTALWAWEEFRRIARENWLTTRVGIAYNQFQYIDGGGVGHADETMTRTQMEAWAADFGDRHVIQNNSIRSDYIDNPSGPRPYVSTSDLYEDIMDMHAAGSPISFQTATAGRVGDLYKTCLWAIDMGAHAVELPSGWALLLTDAQLDDLNTALAANGTDEAVGGGDGGVGGGDPPPSSDGDGGFPAVAATDTYNSGGPQASHTIPYPAGTVEGDGIVLVTSSDNGILEQTGVPVGVLPFASAGTGASYHEVQLWSGVAGAETGITFEGAVFNPTNVSAVIMRLSNRPQAEFLTAYFDTHYGLGSSSEVTFDFAVDFMDFYTDGVYTSAPWHVMWVQGVLLSDLTTIVVDNTLPTTPDGWTLAGQSETDEYSNVKNRVGLYYKLDYTDTEQFPDFTAGTNIWDGIGYAVGWRTLDDVSSGDSGFNEYWEVLSGSASDTDPAASLPTAFGELSDVDDNIDASAVDGDVVMWDGTEWVDTNTIDGGGP